MRILKAALVTALLVHFTACGDSHPADADPFDTFQDCFDDHHVTEGVPVNEAIKICCIDHPIGTPPVGPNVVCGETSAACQTYVDANLDNASATTVEIMTACDGYIIDRAM